MGFDSHGAYFAGLTNVDSLIYYPVGCAVLYVFLNPIVVALIELYRTNIETQKSIKKEKIEGRAFIPYNRYLEMVKNLKDKEDELGNFTKKERALFERELTDHEHTREQLKNMELQYQRVSELTIEAATQRGLALLKGKWQVHFINKPDEIIFWTISIDALHESKGVNSPTQVGRLEDVICPIKTNKIIFSISFNEHHWLKPSRSHLSNFRFHFDESKTELRSLGSNESELTLRKIDGNSIL